MTVYHADGDESISAAIVQALGAVTNTRLVDLPVLYESIDPDALDALFRSRDTEAKVRFEYADHRVTVHSSGEIRLENAMDEPA